MKNFGSECKEGVGIGRNESGKSADQEAFYLGVIENAGGVPFRLVFGTRDGDVRCAVAGKGINELLGIVQGEFSWKVLEGMIEEIVPLSEGAPKDTAEVWHKLINRELESFRAELRVRTKAGETRWISFSLLPAVDGETGKVTGAFGIIFDITESRTVSDRIKEKEEELERLKTDLLHNISHEIRTPLNAIVGFSTLLGEHIDIPERRKEYLDIIIRNSDHLIEIVDDIVEISKIDAKMIRVRSDKVSLYEVLKKVYDQFWPDAYRTGIMLSFEPEHDTFEMIYSDWYKLTEVLRNLVENALKFTFEGRIEFGYTIGEGKIEFYVSDTGTGIPADQQEKVFSRFFQADSSSTRSYDGTGMGLSITKAYVELLGGKIWFTSQQGEGSVFRFTIPYEKAGNNGSRLRIVI
jgi:signal transduction histidine kinase